MKALDYYLKAALFNLMSTSRTAVDGSIDVSAAGSIIPNLSSETLSTLSPQQFEVLKFNKKVDALDLMNLSQLSKEKIKETVIENFKKAIRYVYQLSTEKSSAKTLSKKDIKQLLEKIAHILGEGIIVKEKWLRAHDSEKFPYTKITDLTTALDDFSEQFSKMLSTIPAEVSQRKEWVKETAAWIEYRVNLTDHFIADSCGKTSAVLSAFVCMLGDEELPIFLDKSDYFNKTALPKKRRLLNLPYPEDAQFQSWKRYYFSKFFNPEETAIVNTLHHKMERADYLRAAIDNLIAISHTLQNKVIRTTAYASKAEVVESYNVSTSPAIIANFSRTFAHLCDNRNQSFSSIKEVRYFLLNIVKNINAGLTKFQFEAEQFPLREKDSEIYPYTPSAELKAALDNFIEVFFKKLNEKDLFPIRTAAWLEYEICFHHFFSDGNKRIAIMLSGFYLMRYNLPLPEFQKLKDWEKAAPKERVGKEATPENNIQFQRWYANYFRLFKQPLLYRLPEHKQHQNPWHITADEILYLNGTIYEHITRSREEIIELTNITGMDIKDLVVFKPERVALHECIIACLVSLDLNAHPQLLDQMLSEHGFYQRKILPALNFLSHNVQILQNNFENYVLHILESYLPEISTDNETIQLINKYKEIITKQCAKNFSQIRISVINQQLLKLVADELLRNHFKHQICKLVYAQLTQYIQENNLKRLPLYANFERITWAVVGGPASGKSSLQKEVERMISLSMQMRPISFCKVNPDLYKKYLVKPTQVDMPYFAAITHVESSFIADRLIDKLWEMVKENHAPHLLLDIVKSSPAKMKLAGYGGATVTLYVASCPIEGENGAIQRAFKRAQNKSSDDYGRYVPTIEILRGHKEESVLLSQTIKESKLTLRLFNTISLTPTLTAVIDDYSKNLKIYDPPGFYQFLRKSLMDVNAESEDTVYVIAFDAEKLSSLLMNYLKNGITILFKYSEQVPNPILKNLKEKKSKLVGEALKNNHHLKHIHQKEDDYAILDPQEGFICQDVVTFSKTLATAFNISFEDFIDELVDYEDEQFPQGVPITLYDANTHVKLFQHQNQQFTYNEAQLAQSLPELLKRKRMMSSQMPLDLFNMISQLSHQDEAVKWLSKAIFLPNLSFKKRMAYLTQAIDAKPHYADAYKHRGILYLHANQIVKALEEFNQAIFYAPQNPEYYWIRGNVFSLISDWENAAKSYSLAIDLNPAYTDAYVSRAITHINLMNFLDVLRDFESAIKLAPKNPAIYLQRNKFYAQLGNFEKAIEDCNRALTLLPENNRSDVYLQRALNYRKLKKFAEAIQDLTHALSCARQNHFIIYQERAVAYMKQKDYQKALHDIKEAVKLAPNIYTTYLLSATCKQQLAYKKEKIIKDINKASACNPNDPVILNACANIYFKFGFLEEAIKFYLICLEKAPHLLMVYQNLALAYKQSGKKSEAQQTYESAMQWYEKLIPQDKKNPHLYFNRACLHILFEKNSLAIKDLNMAIELAPLYIDAYQCLISLNKKLSQKFTDSKESRLNQVEEIEKKLNKILASLNMYDSFVKTKEDVLILLAQTAILDIKGNYTGLSQFNLQESVWDTPQSSTLTISTTSPLNVNASSANLTPIPPPPILSSPLISSPEPKAEHRQEIIPSPEQLKYDALNAIEQKVVKVPSYESLIQRTQQFGFLDKSEKVGLSNKALSHKALPSLAQATQIAPYETMEDVSLVAVQFTDLQIANQFTQELQAIGIAKNDGSPKKVNFSTLNTTDKTYTVYLSPVEFNAITNDENAYHELVENKKISGKKL